MPIEGPGSQQLRDLSLRLRAMGTQGQGLRRELYRAINDAARPFAAKISNAAYLSPYMPSRYADVLASDLSVTAVKRGGARASVTIQARGRVHRRQVQAVNAGILSHPLYGNRKYWFRQADGMTPGFFTDAVVEAAPGIRADVQKAMDDVAAKITGH
jgi:hypothetical protein